VGPLIPR